MHIKLQDMQIITFLCIYKFVRHKSGRSEKFIIEIKIIRIEKQEIETKEVRETKRNNGEIRKSRKKDRKK